jgi:hypothetical protein
MWLILSRAAHDTTMNNPNPQLNLTGESRLLQFSWFIQVSAVLLSLTLSQ